MSEILRDPITPGLYRDGYGNAINVIGVAEYKTSRQKLIVYVPLYGPYVDAGKMSCATVTAFRKLALIGKERPADQDKRFMLIEEINFLERGGALPPGLIVDKVV